MVNTDEIQEESRSLVRRQGAIKPSVLFYTLRPFNKSQRQGGPGRQKGKDRGTPVGGLGTRVGRRAGRRRRGFRGPSSAPPIFFTKLKAVISLHQPPPVR